MPTPTELRSILLDQLAYLIDELEAQKGHLARVPPAVLEGRPFDGEPTLKEMYGCMIDAEETIHLPGVERMIRREAPHVAPPDPATPVAQEAWNDVDMPDLLARLQAARRSLVALLKALPPAAWTTAGTLDDLYTLAHAITRHDAENLRTIGYRLHESHLTSRPQDLPK